MRWKSRDDSEWHRWFAWYPVLTEENEWVWLEWVVTAIITSPERAGSKEGEPMNRRDALLAILAMPSAASYAMVREMQDQNGGKISVLSPMTRFILTLADDDDKAGGISELEVHYKNQTLKFSAKEIWDALTLQPLPQGTLTSRPAK